MLIQEIETELAAEEVVVRAREFFAMQASPYAAFEEASGPAHIKFATEAGDLTIGVGVRDGVTVVRGSTSRLHHELSQFLVTLARPEGAKQSPPGPGTSGAG